MTSTLQRLPANYTTRRYEGDHAGIEGQDQLQHWLLLVLLHACVRTLLVVVDLQELAQAISVCWPVPAAFYVKDLW